jgi:putative intracellular protease/amidase
MTGIWLAALAGFTKESQMPAEQKTKAIKEFSFKKGMVVAAICGVTSAFFAFALQAGKMISVASLKAGYVNGAAAQGVRVVTNVEIPAARLDEFVAGLDTAPLGLDKKPTFPGILQTIETNSAFAAKFAANYGTSTNAVGRRVAAYAADFEKVRTNERVASTIKGLGEFSEKELAFRVVSAGGDVVSLQKRYGLWQGLPVLPVLLLGGFTTNLIWCVNLARKNRSGYQFLASHVRQEHAHHSGSDGGEHGPAADAAGGGVMDLKIPALGNYIWSAIAGTTWYFQFFFYQMGTTQMGRYDFASWTLHMSSIIIFATIWGWIFREWKGSSKKAHYLIAGGIATLILGTINIGIGAYLRVK